jgi:aminoglycoside phosphotransferase (APT) family kinase protein
MEYDLTVLERDSLYISRLIDSYFHCDVSGWRKAGQGFYGAVYLVDIPKGPRKVILKCYKHRGRNRREAEQLDLLRKYSLLKIPDVFHVHNYNEEIPFEILIMEYIGGINASGLPSDHPHRDSFVEEMVDNLIHLHSISNEKGFGFDGMMYPDWTSCWRDRVGKMHQILHADFSNVVCPYAMEAADRSFEAFDQIFSEPIARSSLIHSDYNLWNILVDERTAKITAVIDPIDAGWADSELDLFHLQNAEGDRFGLLDHYRSHAQLSRLFPVKNAFYWFWDDIKHLENMGWYEEKRFTEFGRRVLTLMDEHIGA